MKTTKILLTLLSWSCLIASTTKGQITHDCERFDHLIFAKAHKLELKEYVTSSRCILSMDDEYIKKSIDSLVFLLPKLPYYNKLELLDSISKRLKPYTSSNISKYKVNRAIADLERKKQNWHTADSVYALAALSGETEYDKAIAELYSAYCAAVGGNDSRARIKYREGMNTLTNPEILDNEEYFSVYNLSAAINAYLGSQEIAVKNYLTLYSNEQLPNERRAQAAYNMLELYAGKSICDSLRLFAHFALKHLAPNSSKNVIFWQLIRCDGVENYPDSAQLHYSRIQPDSSEYGKYIRLFTQADYFKVTDQPWKIPSLIKTFEDNYPSQISDRQYLIESYISSALDKINPDTDFYIEEYIRIKDSLTGEKIQSNIAESQISMDFALSQAESEKLSKELEFSNRESRLKTIGASVLSGALLISTLLLMTVLKQRKKLKRSNTAVKTLNRELNHRAANQLSLAYELILDQRRQIGDEHAKASLQKSEIQLMALREVNRALANKSDDLVRADQVLQKVAENLQSASPHPFKLDLQLDAITIHGNAASRSALILSELMSNSIKYAFPNQEDAQASLSLQQSDRGISMTYVDNGPGKDGFTRGSGVGSELIEAMLEDIDAEFEEVVGEDGTGYGLRWWWG